jgi:hypothetical protein
VQATGFNEATMVMAYSCNRGAKEEAIPRDPARSKQDSKARENIVQHNIVFVPTPDEHEMFICKASMSIRGAVCGFANIQYQNILNNNDIQLSHDTYKQLHTRPWNVTVRIPLSTMGADGLYSHTKLTPYKMGENISTRQVRTVDNESYCIGQGMVYHGLQYDRERATITIRIKLFQRKLALGERKSNGFKCDSLKHQCTYSGVDLPES